MGPEVLKAVWQEPPAPFCVPTVAVNGVELLEQLGPVALKLYSLMVQETWSSAKVQVMLPEGEVKLVISRAPSGAGALTVAVGVALGVGVSVSTGAAVSVCTTVGVIGPASLTECGEVSRPSM